jgi:putative lipid kinase YegS-like protein
VTASPGDSPRPPGVRPGQGWGTEASGPPDVEVSGGDRILATVLERRVTDPLVRFAAAPDSDLARAVGLVAGAAPTGLALPLDALTVAVGEGTAELVAVNSVAVGVAPDRLRAWHRPAGLSVEIDGAAVEAASATTLVIMNGQYLRGFDLSPRGHPGDGVAEAQLYALPPGARRGMRTRLVTGAHLPHPAITVRRARRLVVRAARPAPLEVDGIPAGRITALEITLRPAAYRLLV